MTKKAFFTDADHSSAAGFKAWVNDLSSALDEIGFIKSADTGQLDVATMTASPAAGVMSGYEIRYLNDSLHSTAPIYAKIEYGSGSVSTPAVRVTVGTGTNGAGTITGEFGARMALSSSPLSNPAKAPYQCYACMVDGLVWVAFGIDRYGETDHSPALFSLVIARTTDAAGYATADGAATYFRRAGWDNFGPTTKSFRSSWASRGPWVGTASRAFGGAAGAVNDNQTWTSNAMGNATSTNEDGAKGLFPHILAFPKIQVVPQIVSLLPGDGIGHGTQLSAAIVGTTPRNYIVAAGFRSQTVERFALIWE